MPFKNRATVQVRSSSLAREPGVAQVSALRLAQVRDAEEQEPAAPLQGLGVVQGLELGAAPQQDAWAQVLEQVSSPEEPVV